MIGGVSFQPGSLDQKRQQMQANGQSSEGVQEAIKVLSLRLPKVVGAQAVAPSALLRSQGSGGNPHVDSIVERVLSKMFPGQGGPAPAAPMMPMGQGPMAPQAQAQPQGPQFSGSAQGASQSRQEAPEPNFWNAPRPPRVVVDNPPEYRGDFTGSVGDFTQPYGPGGEFTGAPSYPGAIEPVPDLRKYLEGLFPSQGPPPSYETPLI